MNIWPQIVIFALLMMNIGSAVYRHGKTETKRENLGAALLSVAILLFLLYMGGFFDPLLNR